jgi:hypothetical protein
MGQSTVRQHFVSAGYLSRFTLGGERDSPFFVFSPDGKPMRQSVPNAVGFENHYHDVDVPGFPRDCLEEFFQKYEASACALFRSLSENPGRTLCSEDEPEALAAFVALQAARIPRAKETYRQLLLRGRQAVLSEMASSPEFFDKAIDAAKRCGTNVKPADQLRLLEAIKGGHILPQVSKTESSIGILRLAHAIADQIDGMHYSLLYSDGPDWFVCSDYPVALFFSFATPGNLLDFERIIEWPTLRSFENTIYMPLAYNVAVAIHRDEGRPMAATADYQMVARINAMAVALSDRFICSPVSDFTCFLPDKELGNAREAVAALKRLRESEAN